MFLLRTAPLSYIPQNITTQRSVNPPKCQTVHTVQCPRCASSVAIGGLVRCAAVERIIEWRRIAISRHDSIVIARSALPPRSILNPMIASLSPRAPSVRGYTAGKVLWGVKKWLMVAYRCVIKSLI